MATNTVYVRAEDPAELEKWAKKWGVSRKEVCDAILHTGYLASDTLKAYVHRDRWICHPVSSTAKWIRTGISLIF